MSNYFLLHNMIRNIPVRVEFFDISVFFVHIKPVCVSITDNWWQAMPMIFGR